MSIEPLLVQVLFWGSFLVFPFAALLYWWSRRIPYVLYVLLMLLTTSFLWARFVEPQLIVVRESTVEWGLREPVTLVLIADMHLGVYKGERFMRRVVATVNELEPDYVLIAGDFTFHPRLTALPRLTEPFGGIEAPTYAVWGNHETQDRFEDVRTPLATLLPEVGVSVLNNEVVELPAFTVVGLGTNRSGEDEVSLLREVPTSSKPTIVLTHNPDTTMRYTPDMQADLTFVGHTHCGQLRIPLLYRYAIPTVGDFDRGWYDTPAGALFITCGLGEVGLPMRFLNPPVVDVITLR